MAIRFDKIALTIAMLNPFALLPLGDILFPNLLMASYRTGLLIPLLAGLMTYVAFSTIFFMAWLLDGKQDAIEIIKIPFKEIKKFYTKKAVA